MKFEFEISTLTEEIFPLSALEILPFYPEPLESWNYENELADFLYKLYEGTGFGEVSENYFADSHAKFVAWAEVFYESAVEACPAPASSLHQVDVPNFMEEPLFGLLAKNYSAWENVVGNIMSEGSFYSLPHLLETRTDLSSSIHLAAHLYYRQAYQVLRGFLESVVIPMYFCDHPEKYLAWKANDYHTPPLRGKDGILNKLKKRGRIDSKLKDEIYELYGLLNNYIHGSESSLNNSGICSGQWAGFVSQLEEYRSWVELFSKCVTVSLSLLWQHHKQWETTRSLIGEICNICHSSDLDSDETDSDLIKLSCNQCSSSFHKKKSDKKKIVLTEVSLAPEK
ncbi:hypothetical protein ACEV8Q_21780 [Vibrio parahaemolyticus]